VAFGYHAALDITWWDKQKRYAIVFEFFRGRWTADICRHYETKRADDFDERRKRSSDNGRDEGD
jgi:hypothetical protein